MCHSWRWTPGEFWDIYFAPHFPPPQNYCSSSTLMMVGSQTGGTYPSSFAAPHGWRLTLRPECLLCSRHQKLMAFSKLLPWLHLQSPLQRREPWTLPLPGFHVIWHFSLPAEHKEIWCPLANSKFYPLMPRCKMVSGEWREQEIS